MKSDWTYKSPGNKKQLKHTYCVCTLLTLQETLLSMTDCVSFFNVAGFACLVMQLYFKCLRKLLESWVECVFECHSEEYVEPGLGQRSTLNQGRGSSCGRSCRLRDAAEMNEREREGVRRMEGNTSRCCRAFNYSPVRLMKRQTLFITTHAQVQNQKPVGLITQTPPQWTWRHWTAAKRLIQMWEGRHNSLSPPLRLAPRSGPSEDRQYD